MSRIYKYAVSEQYVNDIPEGYIVNFGRDKDNRMSVWVQHWEGDDGTMKLYVVGTGWEFPDTDFCVRSVIDGHYVWHLIQKGLAE